MTEIDESGGNHGETEEGCFEVASLTGRDRERQRNAHRHFHDHGLCDCDEQPVEWEEVEISKPEDAPPASLEE